MRIEFFHFSYAVSALKDNVLPVLSEKQKRIAIIVSAALALLAACYVLSRCCGIHAKIEVEEDDDDNTGVNGPGCKVTYGDGTVDEGDFSKGKLNGRGKRTLPNGTMEEGEFKNGKLHGSGRRLKKLDFKNITEEGEFKNGKLHGKGKLEIYSIILHKIQRTCEGEFKEGFFEQGQITYDNGKLEEGKFSIYELHGQGVRTLPNGTVEKGKFDYSELHQGVIINAHGDIEAEGEFKQGELWTGKGKKTFSDGTIHEGEFKKGKLDGKGQVTYPDGEIKQGTFKNGVLQN